MACLIDGSCTRVTKESSEHEGVKPKRDLPTRNDGFMKATATATSTLIGADPHAMPTKKKLVGAKVAFQSIDEEDDEDDLNYVDDDDIAVYRRGGCASVLYGERMCGRYKFQQTLRPAQDVYNETMRDDDTADAPDALAASSSGHGANRVKTSPWDEQTNSFMPGLEAAPQRFSAVASSSGALGDWQSNPLAKAVRSRQLARCVKRQLATRGEKGESMEPAARFKMKGA